MRNRLLHCLSVALVFLSACSSIDPPRAEKSGFDAPGPQSDGTVLLPNQWFLRPVGKQIVLGDFPVNIAVHPGGKYVAVLHCGHGQNEIIVVELPDGKLISRAGIDEAFYGIAFSADGKKVFCSGAGDEVVHMFMFANGYLSEGQSIKLRDAKLRGIPGGLAVSNDGKTLFVANVWGHRVSEVDLASQTVRNEILLGTNALVSIDPNKTTPVSEDEAAITKRAEVLLDQTQSSDPFPYTCVLDEKRERLYVSLWAQAAVAVIDLKSREILARWRTEEHP